MTSGWAVEPLSTLPHRLQGSKVLLRLHVSVNNQRLVLVHSRGRGSWVRGLAKAKSSGNAYGGLAYVLLRVSP